MSAKVALKSWCVAGMVLTAAATSQAMAEPSSAGTQPAFSVQTVSSLPGQNPVSAAPAQPAVQTVQTVQQPAAMSSAVPAATTAQAPAVVAPAPASASAAALPVQAGTEILTAPGVAESTDSASLQAEPAAPAPLTATFSPDGNTVSVSLRDGVDAALQTAFAAYVQARTLNQLPDSAPSDLTYALQKADISADSLQVSFDADKMQQLLSSQGQAVWQGLQSPVLLWLCDATGAQPALTGADGGNAFAAQLTAACQNYHFSVMLPLLDLDDITKVTPETVLKGQSKTLASAAARYGSEYVLGGVLTQDSVTGSSRIRWQLMDSTGNVLGSQEISGSAAELAARTASGTASVLAREAGAQAMQQQQEQSADAVNTDVMALGPYKGVVRVRISGIYDIGDLPKMQRALIIYGYDNALVVAADSEGLIVDIPSSSDPQILDGTMSHAGEFSREGPWHYRWLKSTSAKPAAQVIPAGSSTQI